MASFDLKGKVAIVTGGNGGIGLGMARGLADAGANIVVAARDAAKSQAAVADLGKRGVRAIAVATDVTDAASVKSLVAATVKEFGRVDIMVSNAANNVRKPVLELEPADVAATFDRLTDPAVASAAASSFKGVLSKGGAKARGNTVVFELENGRRVRGRAVTEPEQADTPEDEARYVFVGTGPLAPFDWSLLDDR